MSARARSSQVGVSLFPFLDVLLSTMGSLILMFAIITRTPLGPVIKSAHESGPAVPTQDLEAERELLELRIGQLTQQRDKTQQDLRKRQLELGHLESESQRLRRQLDELVRAAQQLEGQRQMTDKERSELQFDIGRKQGVLARQRMELGELQRLMAEQGPSYAIVPYVGPNGTRRIPVYIECTVDSIVLQPEGIRFFEEDFDGPLGPGNPLAAAVRAAREHIAHEMRSSAGESGEPYPLLLVRPDGIEAYWVAREALQSWGSDFGYELVDAEWELAYKPADERLAERVQQAVDAAREQQQYIAQLAPRSFGSSRAFRANPHGGGIIADDDPSYQPGSETGRGRRGLRRGRAGAGGTGYGNNPSGLASARGSGSGGLGYGGQTRGGSGYGTGVNGTGVNGTGVNGTGVNGTGGDGTGADGTGGMGRGTRGTGFADDPNRVATVGEGSGGGTSDRGWGSNHHAPPGNGFGGATGGATGSGADPNQLAAVGDDGGVYPPEESLDGNPGLGGTGRGSRAGSPSGYGDASEAGGAADGSDSGQAGGGRRGNSPNGNGGSAGALAGSNNRSGGNAGGAGSMSSGGQGSPGSGSGMGGPGSALASMGPIGNSPLDTPGTASGRGPKKGQQGGGGINYQPPPATHSMADKRGKDWGKPEAARGAAAVTRPIVVQCRQSSLALMNDDGSRRASQVISLDAETEDSVDDLVSAVWKHIDKWGIAGNGMYWHPVLMLQVEQGGEQRASDLETLLSDSGIDVKRRTTGTAQSPAGKSRR